LPRPAWSACKFSYLHFLCSWDDRPMPPCPVIGSDGNALTFCLG
jgi:hypothetical protein